MTLWNVNGWYVLFLENKNMDLQNANPTVYEKSKERDITEKDEDENVYDEIDAREIFDILSYVRKKKFYIYIYTGFFNITIMF